VRNYPARVDFTVTCNVEDEEEFQAIKTALANVVKRYSTTGALGDEQDRVRVAWALTSHKTLAERHGAVPPIPVDA
jgi:hypothetical protein